MQVHPFHARTGHARTAVRSGAPRFGFTLVEVAVVSAVILVGLLALTSTTLSVHSLRKADQERRVALSALKDVTETMHAFSVTAGEDETGWATVLTTAFAAGGDPGAVFDVAELEPWEGEDQIGTITVVTDETMTDAELGVVLGMPRDLDNDGIVDNTDTSTTAKLLPVILRARWQSAGGEREIVQGFFVAGF